MKTKKIVALAIGAFTTVSSFAQTVDEIIDKHTMALGGIEKLSAVNTIITERTLSVQGMDIPSKTILIVGKSLRSESTMMGNSMVQVLTGTTSWMIRPAMMGGTGDAEDMPNDQIKQQKSQLDPFGPLINYKQKGNTVELVGQEKLDKKSVYHVKITTKDGQIMDEYLDANTYLVSQIKTTINGQEGEIAYSDYRVVEGIKFPYTTEMTNGQMGTITFITNKTVVNAKIDEAIFKKPTK